MKRIACQYAIVRFAPFIETGEFANVGVIMLAAGERYFGFKLETRRYARVTRFFDELDAQLYRAALFDLRDELNRIHGVLKDNGFDHRRKYNDLQVANDLFAELIRPRESIVRFSEPRVVLAENPNKKLEELFGYYIERSFVTRQYRETVLEKGMRRWLAGVQASERFVKDKIGDHEYQATFPFVERSETDAVKIIKPLHLGQETPSKIIDHGGVWALRIRELRRRNVLPRKVLFAVDGADGRDARGRAFSYAVDQLEDTGVAVLPYQDKRGVLDFALAH